MGFSNPDSFPGQINAFRTGLENPYLFSDLAVSVFEIPVPIFRPKQAKQLQNHTLGSVLRRRTGTNLSPELSRELSRDIACSIAPS